MDGQMSVDLQGELLADLTSELEAEPTFSSTKLFQKVVGAIREVKRARKYPKYYTDEQIAKDLYDFYSNIRNIALYDYNAIGAEFEKSHSENGTSRSYEDRDKLFYGILPLAR